MSALALLCRRIAAPVGAVLLLAACDGMAAQDEFWRPWYEAPPVDPTDPTDPTDPLDLSSPSGRDLGSPVDARGDGPLDSGPTPGNCSLAVTVTTVSPGGRYSPRNIGAIWVSDSTDHFIKTLAVWADKRAKYLKRWQDATAAARVPGSRVDAISSATKSSHGIRTGTWNCTDTAAMRVADGSYKVCFELTDFDGTGPYDCIAFTKSPAPFSAMPGNVSSFTARKLELTP